MTVQLNSIKPIFKNNNGNPNRELLRTRYKDIRSFTEELTKPLSVEDFVIQSMDDVSPTKWHLAHTSWFFEAFLLKEKCPNYKPLKEIYDYFFNSYYVQIGDRFPRPQRGLLSRPTVKEVLEFRKFIDEHMLEFFETADEKLFEESSLVIEIGLQHEQQHQELLLTDIKHVLSQNPLAPIYLIRQETPLSEALKNQWISFEEGITEIGHSRAGFFYDNEIPRHKEYLHGYKLASRLITNEEFIEFIEDGGYSRQEIWLSDGAAAVDLNRWEAPLYWKKIGNEWWNFSLSGLRKVEPNEPVCHVSMYEADAFARWAGARLATESEWEHASEKIKIEGNFVENKTFHPVPLNGESQNINQMFGDVWEWTRSDYCAYPGYKTPAGAIGEYNGKFMSGQNVLRGGSCATSKNHIRKTYRNFFPPTARWQFSGIRLAKD